MSHTYKAPGGTLFHHNSDLSGEVSIVTPARELNVEGADLLAFVANWVREQRMSALEEMPDADVFGLPSGTWPSDIVGSGRPGQAGPQEQL